MMSEKEKKKKHILLQGERGAGKSYLIRKLVRDLGVVPGGYLTRAVFNAEKGYREVLLYPASWLLADGDQDDIARRCGRLCGIAAGGRGKAYPDVFAGYGTQLLRSSADKKLIVMDEIGFMENDARSFRDAVLSALAGDTPVIAAVKAGNITTPFLEAVRSHPDAELFELDEEDRDEAYRQIKERLAENLRAGEVKDEKQTAS